MSSWLAGFDCRVDLNCDLIFGVEAVYLAVWKINTRLREKLLIKSVINMELYSIILNLSCKGIEINCVTFSALHYTSLQYTYFYKKTITLPQPQYS